MSDKQHDLVYGLGFGDEGKGATVDFLSSHNKYAYNIRFSGGAQAGHNVVLDNGVHHEFRQFGAASFNGVPTFMANTTVFDPHTFLVERQSLQQKTELTDFYVHPDAVVATPMHVEANIVRNRILGHGSVGMGVGEAIAHHRTYMWGDTGNFDPPSTLKVQPIYARHLSLSRQELRTRLAGIEQYFFPMTGRRFDLDMIVTMFKEAAGKIRVEDVWEDIIQKRCIFEGSQGVLLDEYKGWLPHTTWGRLDYDGISAYVPPESVRKIGVTRTYHTRHGAGPFYGENSEITFPEPHNREDGMQGRFRQGNLNLEYLDYAMEASQVDRVSVTHLDRSVTPCRANDSAHHLKYDIDILEYLDSAVLITKNGPERGRASFMGPVDNE